MGSNDITTPLKPGRTILGEESADALNELRRPAGGLFLSGLIAGFSIGVGVLAMATVRSLAPDDMSTLTLQLLLANAYAIGFVIVVLGHTDLFTEYTTIALLPLLGGEASVHDVARLWAIVYVSNIIAATAFAAIAAMLGPALGAVAPDTFGTIALHLTQHNKGTIVLSSILAGWLMGVMSWLVSAGRDTMSQIFFVWLIAFVLGFIGLHHCITGTIQVLAGVFSGGDVGLADYGRLLALVTAGNIVGGVVFAGTIRYSVMVGGGQRGRQGGGRRNTRTS